MASPAEETKAAAVAAAQDCKEKDASVTIQRRRRGTIARVKAQKRANEKGFMTAMPGTTKGKSGWYGFGSKVVMLAVGENKAYSRVGDPLTVEMWTALYGDATYSGASAAVKLRLHLKSPPPQRPRRRTSMAE